MDIYEFFDSNNISYERHDHPAVYTVEEANRLVPRLPGAKTKNLFVRDKKGDRHLLVVVSHEKSVDMKALGSLLGTTKLSLASPDRLKKHLGVEPGAVSLLGLYNDREEGVVEIVVDRKVWDAKALTCHPLVNTSTLVMPMDDVRKFLELTGHEPSVHTVPSR